MQTFQFKGYDFAGNATVGEMVAASVDEVERKLLNQQITLVSVKASKRRSSAAAASTGRSGHRVVRGRRISDGEAAKILSSLGSMVNAGVPFVEALDAIIATARKETVLLGIRDLKTQIIEGRSLADALRSAKTLFPPLVGELVRVAEEGGDLATSLTGASSILSRSAQLRRKVKNAMLYPIVMLSVSFSTVIVLVVFVMPKFAEVFQQMNAEIPITTQMLIRLGVLIRGNPWACGIGFLGGIVGLRFAARNERVAHVGSKIAAKLPGLGDLLHKLALSRALQAIASLVKVNVPVVQALDHGARVSGSRPLSEAIGRCMTSIQQGETLFNAFSQHKIFPPTLTQMIGVGERTGNLGSMLSTCAEEMETEADEKLKSLVSVLEPLMIVVMGLIVGTITVSIITPIYSAVQNIR